VINKWDLAVVAARDAASRDAATAKGKSKRAPGERHKPENFDAGRLMFDYEKMIRAKLKFLSYAPIVFLSAKTGERADRLFPLINQCWEARRRRISTPVLNNGSRTKSTSSAGTTPKARPVRIYYMTQAKIAPPTFLIFTNQKEPLHFSYQRFLENQLRAKFDFRRHARPFHPAPSQTRPRLVRGPPNEDSLYINRPQTATIASSPFRQGFLMPNNGAAAQVATDKKLYRIGEGQPPGGFEAVCPSLLGNRIPHAPADEKSRRQPAIPSG